MTTVYVYRWENNWSDLVANQAALPDTLPNEEPTGNLQSKEEKRRVETCERCTTGQ